MHYRCETSLVSDDLPPSPHKKKKNFNAFPPMALFVENRCRPTKRVVVRRPKVRVTKRRCIVIPTRLKRAFITRAQLQYYNTRLHVTPHTCRLQFRQFESILLGVGCTNVEPAVKFFNRWFYCGGWGNR